MRQMVRGRGTRRYRPIATVAVGEIRLACATSARTPVGRNRVCPEIRHRAQRAAGARHAARVVQHKLAAFGLEILDDLAVLGGRERLEPAPRHLLVAPPAARQRVVAQHQVEVVVEHRVGVDVDGEAGRELPHALDQPAAAVGVVAVAVGAAQEGAAHAARHEVVVALVHGIDQQTPWGCHAADGPWSRHAAVSANCHGRRGRNPLGLCDIGPDPRGTKSRVSGNPGPDPPWDEIACVRKSARKSAEIRWVRDKPVPYVERPLSRRLAARAASISFFIL